MAASTFQPVQGSKIKKFEIWMLHTLIVPDNIEAIQVFDNDSQIKDFMMS